MDREFLGLRVPDRAVTGPQVAKTIIGAVAERLVAQVVGGIPWDQNLPAFPIPGNVAKEVDGSPYGLVPDIWWPKESGFIEVKAGIDRYYATDRQWRSYLHVRDWCGPGFPVLRPRVFYAFLAYRLHQRTDRYRTAHPLVEAALKEIRYLLVADSRLVERFVQTAKKSSDVVGPLSPVLGPWHAYWNLRVPQLQRWADAPATLLETLGPRWRAQDLRTSYQAVSDRIVAGGWPALPTHPAVLFSPRRKSRVGPVTIVGSQARLFEPVVLCVACGAEGPMGVCPQCGELNAF